MKFQNRCKYCGQTYKLSFNDHKVRSCSEYPLAARVKCKYCEIQLDRSNHAHLVEDCQRVPPIIKKWAIREHHAVDALKDKVYGQKIKAFQIERESKSVWIVNGEKRPKK